MGCSSPSLSLEYIFCVLFPTAGTLPRRKPWENNVLLIQLDGLSDWTQLRPPYKLLRFQQVVQRSIGLEGEEDKPRQYVPLLLNLPPTSLEWLPLSSVSPCPPHLGDSLWVNSYLSLSVLLHFYFFSEFYFYTFLMSE